jgi:hypothetical protein
LAALTMASTDRVVMSESTSSILLSVMALGSGG